MRICIVIPTHNRKNLLQILLRQLHSQKLNCETEIFTIVVNDGSTDNTNEMICSEFQNIYIINGDGSWWYTKSMNEGFKYSLQFNPDFILALNDDLEIKENYLSSLINSYNQIKDGSILGSITITQELPYRITFSGNKIKNRILNSTSNYMRFMSKVNLDNLKVGIKETLTLPGRGMFIPISTLLKLNYFDESFPQYYSDWDFCLRAKKNGYSSYVSYDSVIFSHIGLTSVSSSFKDKSLKDFILSFFDIHSRNYLPIISLQIWRHGVKFLYPVIFIITIAITFKNFIFKKKLN